MRTVISTVFPAPVVSIQVDLIIDDVHFFDLDDIAALVSRFLSPSSLVEGTAGG